MVAAKAELPAETARRLAAHLLRLVCVTVHSRHQEASPVVVKVLRVKALQGFRVLQMEHSFCSSRRRVQPGCEGGGQRRAADEARSGCMAALGCQAPIRSHGSPARSGLQAPGARYLFRRQLITWVFLTSVTVGASVRLARRRSRMQSLQ